MSSDAAQSCVTVKFVSGEPDLLLRLRDDTTAAALIEQVNVAPALAAPPSPLKGPRPFV